MAYCICSITIFFLNVENIFILIFKNVNYTSSVKQNIFSTWQQTCGIIVSLDRSWWRPIFEMSIPSIIMLPCVASIIRNRESASEDFPAPVLPTTPT